MESLLNNVEGFSYFLKKKTEKKQPSTKIASNQLK